MKQQLNRLPNAPSSLPYVAPSEWKFVWLMTAIALIFTSLPYVYAYLSTPSDKHFLGVVLNTLDHGQYFSWFREFQTANLSANKLTSEPNAPIFFNLMWWFLAKLSIATGTSYHVMYQLMRVVGALFFFPAVYKLCAWFFGDVFKRRVAFLVVLLTSGFGWVLIVLKYTVMRGELINPLDVFVAEGNTLLSLMGYPHFIAAATYIWAFDFFMRFEATNKYKFAFFSGLTALFLGWQHGYDLFIIWGVIAAYIFGKLVVYKILPMRSIIALIGIGLLSCSAGLYSFLLTQLDPTWKAVLAQFDNGEVFTPPPYRLPVLMGIPFILAVLGVVTNFVHRRKLPALTVPKLFITAWFVVSFLLIYIPTDFQIHMLNGWQVPTGILATAAFFDWVAPRATAWLNRKKWGATWANPAKANVILAALLLASIAPTNVYLWAWRFTELRKHTYPYFLRQDDMAALRWLDANAKPDDAILSSRDVGTFLPTFTGSRAYFAHWAQTLDYYIKEKKIKAFFALATPNAERERILSEQSVDYVIYGDAERLIGENSPRSLPSLKRVFGSGTVEVYQVISQ